MKRIFSFSIIILACAFIFASCGIEGNKEIAGIQFVSDVFYVDYNVETFLDYKVYPSTAEDVYVTYKIENSNEIDNTFIFTQGRIKVIDKAFTTISVTLMSNQLSDSCKVRLKEYPTAISFDKQEDYVNAGSVYYLDLKGVFGDGVKMCEGGDFNYKITSNNTSVIEVISEENLLLKSTGRRGSAKIDVQIFNSVNQEMSGLKTSINLIVVETLNDSFVTLDSNRVLRHNETTILTKNISDELLLEVMYFSDLNLVNKLADFNVYLSNDNVFEIVEKEGKTYLKVVGEGVVEITIQSTAHNNQGVPIVIKNNIEVQISE